MDKIHSHLSSIFTENHRKKENISKEDIRGTAHTTMKTLETHSDAQARLKANRIVLRIQISHTRTLLKSHLLYLLYHTVI